MSIVKSTYSFGAGEITPWLDPRTDLDKYGSACQLLRNFIPHPQGAIQKRPGMEFIDLLPIDVTNARLIEFQTSVAESSMLVVGGGKLRVYTNGAPTAVALDVPWQDWDLLILRWKQINDVMYFVHPDFTPWKLTRYSPTDWALAPVDLGIYVPLLPENLDDDHTVTVSFPTNNTAPAWSSSSVAYKAGNRVTYSGSTWVCLIDHTSNVSRVPPTGTIAVTIPGRTPQVVVKRLWTDGFVDGSAVIGQIVDLTASLDTWQAGHVGAAFEIAKKRKADNFETTLKATTSSGNVGTGAITTYSSVLVVQGHWTAQTFGTWQGIFTIEKSDDRGVTWEEVRSWHMLKDEEYNVNPEGTEDKRVLMRVRWNRVAGEVGTLSGSPRMTLSVDDGKIRGLVQITQVTDARTAKAIVLSPVEATTTYYWSEGAWSDVQGYPRTVELHQGRIVMGATNLRPHSIWGSVVDDYENFYLGTDADDAYYHTLAIGERDPILWLISERFLLIGTGSGEFIMHGEQEDNAITPENGVVKRQSSLGSHNGGVPATFADSVSLFVQRGGTRIREFSFKFDVDRYDNANLSLLAEHMLTAPVDDIAIQRMPFQVVWFLSDWKVYGMTYERTQNIAAWHRLETAGQVVSIGAVRGADGEDEVWFLVRRGGNLCVERFRPDSLIYPVDDGWWMDGAVKLSAPYDLASIPQLVGEEVMCCADDGNFYGPATLGSTWPFPGGVMVNGIREVVEIPDPDGFDPLKIDPNGLFRRAGTRQGKAWYLSPKFASGKTYIQWVTPYGAPPCWMIYLEDEPAFTSPEDTDTPDEVTAWESVTPKYNYGVMQITPILATPGQVSGVKLGGYAVGSWPKDLFQNGTVNGRPFYSADGRTSAPFDKDWTNMSWSGTQWVTNWYQAGSVVQTQASSSNVATPDLATWPTGVEVTAAPLVSDGDVIIGLPYTAAVMPMKPEIQLANGTSRTREVKVHRIVPSLRWSRGGKFGQSLDGPFDPLPGIGGPGQPLFTGEVEVEFDGGFKADGNVVIASDEPVPFAVRALTVKLNVYGDAN